MKTNQETDKEVDTLTAESMGGGSMPTCRFCGTPTLPDMNYISEEDAIEAATLKCDCASAKVYQADIRAAAEFKETADKVDRALIELEKYCEAHGVELRLEIIDLLTRCAGDIINKFADSITVKFGRIKVSVGTNAKGNLAIGYACSDSAKTEVI